MRDLFISKVSFPAMLLLALLVLALPGCGQQWEKNSEEDRELARETLLAALDAWKAGDTTALAKRDPPIRFSDDEQLSGLKLTEYELIDEEAPIDPFRDVEVELTLRDARGETLQKVAKYQVGLDPSLTVLRSDN